MEAHPTRTRQKKQVNVNKLTEFLSIFVSATELTLMQTKLYIIKYVQTKFYV